MLFRSGTLANRMILTGQKVSASVLKACEFVTHLSPVGSLDSDLNGYIQKNIIPKSAASLRMANTALRDNLRKHYRQHISRLEGLYLSDLMKTHDAVEGIKAFVEKRPPQWKNS